MKKQIGWIYALLLICCLSVRAQNSYQSQESVNRYAKGVLAFDAQNYQLAQNYFDKIVSEKNFRSIEVYSLLCGIEANQAEAGENVEDYLEKHPFSVYKRELVLGMANYYFKKRKTKTAFKWFHQIDVKFLTAKEEVNYNYKMAFANYRTKKFTKAKEYLLLISNDGGYKNEANYYLANIAMQTKDYDTALEHLEKIKTVAKYQNEIAYQKLIILFQQKKYTKAVELGESNFKRALGSEKSEMAKIIGESYFYIENYKKALEFLSQYKGRSNNYTEVDYYFVGYALYCLERYKEALQKFNKITYEKNEVAQNAHYHLGDCYLKLNQKTEALNAFKNASEMDFDIAIQKDAFLNYAKLSYEIGNLYQSSSKVLQDFVDAYPNAIETEEIKGLIINAYLQYKDYQGAIDYYRSQNILKDKKYQAVLLEKGFELYNEQKFTNALVYFTEAFNLFFDKELKIKALFWKAQTLAEINQLEAATYSYKSFVNNNKSNVLKEYLDGVYGLAYSLFQQKKYAEAVTYFKKYVLESTNAQMKNDAILRIGDCYYVTKNYTKALVNYNQVILNKINQVDYATYQKALAYGFLGQNEQKKQVLEGLQKDFMNSPYLDNSYYQLGNLYVNQNKKDQAILAYDNLINRFPKSPLLAKTQLKKGLVFFNSGENQKAIFTLKEVVKNYPATGEAVQAVKIAEQVYKEIDEVDVYASWVKTLEFINISDADIDKTMFEAVESRYLSNSLKKVVTSGKKYISNFPNGIYSLTVNFYIAQAYYNLSEKVKAIPFYINVIESSNNEYTEVAVNRLSQIYLENENWDLASPLLLRLETDSKNLKNISYAQSNLMKYYFVKENYQQALLYTYKVLDTKNSTEQAITDAYVFGARSAIFMNKLDRAKKYYTKLETIGKGEVLAEANYYKALWLHYDKNYKESNAQIQILASKYQTYKYWGIKGLLLMAQNFHELEDDFQADFILKNIIENAEDFPTVMKKAEELLEVYASDKIEKNKEKELLKDVDDEL